MYGAAVHGSGVVEISRLRMGLLIPVTLLYLYGTYLCGSSQYISLLPLYVMITKID